MRINHNIAALNTHRQLTNNTAGASKSLEKLSSGFRINRAGDDAAGLAISEKMRGQIRGLEMAMKNSQDSISLIQTAEGAMNEIHSILQRMRELSVQAVNDTNTTTDREELQKEINQLTSEINRIGNTTEFNEKKLLNGDLSTEFVTQAGNAGTTTTIEGVQATAQVVDVTTGEAEVVWSGDSTASFTVEITGPANNGMDWDLSGAGGGTLIISRNSGGFTVTLSGVTDTTGRSLAIVADAVSFDADTQTYSYNNQGISFSFTVEQAEDWSVGDSVNIALASGTSVASGEFYTGSENLFTVSVGSGGTTADLGNITVASGTALLDVSQIHVSTSSGMLRVTFQKVNASGVASGIATYELSAASGQTVNFDVDGISFTFTGGSASGVGSGTFKLDTVATSTSYTTGATADETEDRSLVFQTGSNENQTTTLSIEDVRASALKIISTTSGAEGFSAVANVTKGTDGENVEYALDITTSANAAKAITVIDTAIKQVSSERSKLGAVQNRLEHTINNLGTSAENLTAAESRIRDVDMAKEMMAFTKDNILTQAAQAMLAQANQQPQGVLQLLR